MDFNAPVQLVLDPELVFGEDAHCQFWARDPAASFGSSRSNAIRFKLAP